MPDNALELILPGTHWQHRNGNHYYVMHVANQHADDRDRYPLLVVYHDEQDRIWSKTVERFLGGMTLVEQRVAKQRTWTMAELRRAKERVELDETWDEVAADMGVHSSTLRKQVYRVLGTPDLTKRARLRKNREREQMLLNGIAEVNGNEVSWSIAAERVGWKGESETFRQACRRYAKKHGLKLRKGTPKVRRSRWGSRE